MKTEQQTWTKENGWRQINAGRQNGKSDLVLAFGARSIIEDKSRYQELRDFYPNADIVMGSTAGEIVDTHVVDDSIIATAISFEKTNKIVEQINIADVSSSYEAGRLLAKKLDAKDLVNVFVLSDGQKVNGSELAKGLNDVLPKEVIVTGGLAGDAANFERTAVGANQKPQQGNIIAIGFYGSSFQIGHGSMGGWDQFGPERVITKSHDNVLYEVDELPALDLYKKYLGDQAAELPGSALLFPLCIKSSEESEALVRTILSIDEEKGSMTFAGDMPQGYRTRLMRANFERLIDGAVGAANISIHQDINSFDPQLAILISCVGRKLVLNDRIEEEVEGVRKVLGDNTAITGFYSYGEISPVIESAECKLHNQTMTITTFAET